MHITRLGGYADNVLNFAYRKNDEIACYPNSPYKALINESINIEYTQGNWGYGMYVNMGSIAYSGDLKKYLDNPFLLMITFDVNYSKFDLNFGIGGSFKSKLKSDFYADTLWRKGDQYLFSPIIEATLGYHIVELRHLNISPFIGVRYLGMAGSAPGESSYYESVERPESLFPLTYGLQFDYKFGYGTCNSIYLNRRGGYNERIFADIRLKIGYQNPGFENTVPDLEGGLWYFTLGFGFNSYPPKRNFRGK